MNKIMSGDIVMFKKYLVNSEPVGHPYLILNINNDYCTLVSLSSKFVPTKNSIPKKIRNKSNGVIKIFPYETNKITNTISYVRLNYENTFSKVPLKEVRKTNSLNNRLGKGKLTYIKNIYKKNLKGKETPWNNANKIYMNGDLKGNMKFELKNVCRLIEEDGKHEYVKLNGEKITTPSVTGLVAYYYPFEYDKTDPKAVEMVNKGTIRGKHVHKALEIYLKTNFKTDCHMVCDVKTHPQSIEKAIYMWDIVKNQYELKQILSEVSLYNDLFCGTFDALGVNENNDLYLIDFKTTNWSFYGEDEWIKIMSKEALQLALYEKLIGQKTQTWTIINPSKKTPYTIPENLKKEAYEKANELIKMLKNGYEFKK